MGTLLFLLLTITEAASGYACRSLCENACNTAGNSVLSEYNKTLYDRYGVFALRANDGKLADISSFYIENSLASKYCLVRPVLKESQVSSENFSGLSYKPFLEQIKGLGLQSSIYTFVDENTLYQLISGLESASDFAEYNGASTIKELDTLLKENHKLIEENARVDTTEEQNIAESGKELISSYNEALNPEFDNEQGVCIDSGLIKELPSTLLEVKRTGSLILSGGISTIGTESFLCGKYIIDNCSNQQRQKKDTLLKAEVEYILYGNYSEGDNLKSLKRSLFSIRFPLNLDKIYTNPEKLSEYSTAATAFLPVPIELSVFIMASLEASANSLKDIDILCSGGPVPFFPGGKDAYYTDYLNVLLLFLPQDVKMTRLMDIMQLNIAEIDKEAFAFRDFCYGFNLMAKFEKRLTAPIIDISGIRTGTVSMDICYK